MEKKERVFKYLKFEQNTGILRSKTVGRLVELGVCEMPRIFLHVRTAHLANVYALIVKEDADLKNIDLYVEHQDPIVVSYIPEETIKEYKKEYESLNIEDGHLHFYL